MSEKVLIVDDEQEFIEVLAERMVARGMEVTKSLSATDALDHVKKEAFDVVVLDLQMPEIDGLEALKLLKEQKPDIQVILLTGHATVQKGIEAMKLGAMDLLEKPADLNMLTEKIHKAQANKMILLEKKTEKRIQEIMETRGW